MSCWRLRITGTGRSETEWTRSTKSGPGRCSVSRLIPSQRYSRSARASAPRTSEMALMPLVSMTLAVLMRFLLIDAGGEGAQLGRLLAYRLVARDVARLLQVLFEL